MRLLAMETTSEDGSVALFEAGRLVAWRALQPESYSMQLLPAIVALLEQCGWRAAELAALAAAAGPGSFTGVRVGLSAVKGMVEAWQKPAIAVSTLAALAASVPPAFGAGEYSTPAAQPAPETEPDLASPAIAVLDASRREVYFGVYPRGPLAAMRERPLRHHSSAAPPATPVAPAGILQTGALPEGVSHGDVAQAGAAHEAALQAGDLQACKLHLSAVHEGTGHVGAVHEAVVPFLHESVLHEGVLHEGIMYEGLAGLDAFARRLEALPPWPVYLLDSALGAQLGIAPQRLRPRSGALSTGVGRLAMPLLAAGQSSGALELDAHYIRRSDAELISLPRLLAR